MGLGLSFTIRSGHVAGERGQRLFVTISECDNCGWRSGWNLEPETQRLQRLHDLRGCDCRLKPAEAKP